MNFKLFIPRINLSQCFAQDLIVIVKMSGLVLFHSHNFFPCYWKIFIMELLIFKNNWQTIVGLNKHLYSSVLNKSSLLLIFFEKFSNSHPAFPFPLFGFSVYRNQNLSAESACLIYFKTIAYRIVSPSNQQLKAIVLFKGTVMQNM